MVLIILQLNIDISRKLKSLQLELLNSHVLHLKAKIRQLERDYGYFWLDFHRSVKLDIHDKILKIIQHTAKYISNQQYYTHQNKLNQISPNSTLYSINLYNFNIKPHFPHINDNSYTSDYIEKVYYVKDYNIDQNTTVIKH